MKKFFFAAALAFFGIINAQSGNFKVGVHLGSVTGDFKTAYGLNPGVDVAYLWKVAPNFDLGLTTGYSHYVTKSAFVSIGGKSMNLIPLAVTGQYNMSEGFFLGADLGYASLLYDGDSTGSFYYQPKLGYTFVEKHDLYLSYKSASKDGNSLSSVNLGYAYKF